MSLSETLIAQTPLGAALRAGVDTLSLNQEIVFTKYVRLVLPLDGFVFWVKADLLSESALMNAARMNSVAANGQPSVVTPASTISVRGALHYGTDNRQEELNTASVNSVVFTSESEVDGFNEIGQNVLLLGEFDGLRFSFNKRGSFFRQAELYHYVGDAVYHTMDSQFIDSLEGFDVNNVVVSNSLPLWLALTQPTGIPLLGGIPCPLYPSYLVPQNLLPPYGVVHVVPETTVGLQGAPFIARDSTHTQLATEHVRITFYGVRNFGALDFQDYVLDYTDVIGSFGIMNIPVVRDDKQWQSEISVLAMRKTIEFDVNYYQTRANTVARQLILSAFCAVFPEGLDFTSGLASDGGVLVVALDAYLPTSPTGLPPGAVWSNGRTVARVPGPSDGSLVIYLAYTTAEYLLLNGALNLPSTPGTAGSGQIWNNGGELAVS
jgi:hypothetical protein